MDKHTGLIKDMPNKSHEESSAVHIERDEAHVRSLNTHLQQNMTNPFEVESHPDVLFNISTGLHATSEVQESLINAVPTGQLKAEMFIEKTLSSNSSTSFYAPVP